MALELPDRYFGDVVELLNVEELSTAVKELESDDQTDFMQELEEVDQRTADAVFNALDADDQAEILQLKQYNENEAGAYMQMEVYAANICLLWTMRVTFAMEWGLTACLSSISKKRYAKISRCAKRTLFRSRRTILKISVT